MTAGPTGPTEAIPVTVVPFTGEVIDMRDLDACRAAVLDVRRMIDELVEVRRDLSSHVAITERHLERIERERLLARIAELERMTQGEVASIPVRQAWHVGEVELIGEPDETTEGGTG